MPHVVIDVHTFVHFLDKYFMKWQLQRIALQHRTVRIALQHRSTIWPMLTVACMLAMSPIPCPFVCLSHCLLNGAIVSAFTTYAGSVSQSPTTLCAKKNLS